MEGQERHKARGTFAQPLVSVPLFHPLIRVLLFVIAAVVFAIALTLPGVVLIMMKDPARLELIVKGHLLRFSDNLVLAGQYAGILAAVVLFCRVVDRRPLVSLGLGTEKSFVQQSLLGLVFAVWQVAFIFLIIFLLGGRWEMTLEQTLTPLGLFGYAVFFLFQGGIEELADRGYVLQALLTRYSPVTSVALSSCLFSGAHALNPGLFDSPLTGSIGIVNLFLYGVFAAVSFLRFGTLWFAIVNHAAWNWILGNILGTAVSGLTLSERLVTFQFSGPDWVTGGPFGLEGSVACTLTLVLATAVLYLIPSQPPRTWWQAVRDLTREQDRHLAVPNHKSPYEQDA
ncbi:MAG: CPBP family intramembrane glutamic endopeptidase [Armatimonadota bacterium]|nr:CPBP family intramembrane glutamic endopeptidase [Armatimonadota bacterium]